MAEPTPQSPARPFTALIAWFAEYAKQNPFKVLSTSTLAFGCFLLVPVFLGIGELPQLDVASMLPLLGTIAVGGVVLIVILAGIPVAGGLLARSQPNAPVWRSDGCAVLIYVLPGIGMALFFGVFINWPAYWEGRSEWAIFLWMAFGPVGLAGVRIWTLCRSSKAKIGWISEWAILAWNSFALTALTTYLVGISIVIVSSESQTMRDLYIAIAAWTVYASVVTIVAVRVKTTEIIRIMLAFALFVTIVLLAATGGMTSISKAMLKKTGWGNYPAKLFVTDRGCDIFNRSTGRELCKQGKGAGGHLVCPVMVRSRIGTPNFFAFSSFTSSGKWPDPEKAVNVSLPKEDVIVLQRIELLANPKKPTDTHAVQSPAAHFVPQAGEQGRWLQEQCGQIPALDSANETP